MEAQALGALAQASGQLELQIAEDIRYLVEERYKTEKDIDPKTAMDARVIELRGAIEALTVANSTRAAIYCAEGELDSMVACLEGFAEYTKVTLLPHHEIIAECDGSDNEPTKGFWKERLSAIQVAAQLRSLIQDSEPMTYIEVDTLDIEEGFGDSPDGIETV